MRLVTIRVQIGNALRPEELIDIERIEVIIECVVAVSLQAHFDLVNIDSVSLSPSDEVSDDSTPRT